MEVVAIDTTQNGQGKHITGAINPLSGTTTSPQSRAKVLAEAKSTVRSSMNST
jgi:hypothetical protein